MSESRLTIAVQPLGEGFVTLGTDRAPGSAPQNIRWSKRSKGGAADLFFDVYDDTRKLRDDLREFTPVIVYDGEEPRWVGRMIATPRERGQQHVFHCEAHGMWNHLQDKRIDKAWVVSDLGLWKDSRGSLKANLASYGMNGSPSIGSGGIVLANDKGTEWRTSSAPLGAVTLDLGPNNNAIRAVVFYESSANFGPSTTLYVRGADVDDFTQAIDSSNFADFATVTTPAASGTLVGNVASPRRYVHIFPFYGGGVINTSADTWIRIRVALIFTDSADSSGNTSILKASTVFSEAITLGCPLISTDHSLIQATTFSIPEKHTGLGQSQSVEEIADGVNAFHGHRMALTDEWPPRPIMEPVPTVPAYALGKDDSYILSDPSANNGRQVFSDVVAEFEDAGGIRRTVVARNDPYYHEVMSDAPAAYWRMDDTDTAIGFMRDVAGRANHGRYLNTPTPLTGPIASGNGAMTFNGTNEYGLVSSDPELHPADTFSFECWYKRGTTGTYQTIFANAATNDVMIFFGGTGGAAGDKINLHQYGVGLIWQSTATYTDTSSWHHLVVTKTGATVAVYLDGAAIAGTLTNRTLVATTARTYIGFDAGSSYFNGSLDEVALYPTALSAARVLTHYNAARAPISLTAPEQRGSGRELAMRMQHRMTPAAAYQLAKVRLDASKVAPFAATIRVQGYVRDFTSGAPLHCSRIEPGRLILLEDEEDKFTGQMGRVGLIQQVDYEANTGTATIVLDNNLDGIDQLQARYGALAA